MVPVYTCLWVAPNKIAISVTNFSHGDNPPEAWMPDVCEKNTVADQDPVLSFWFRSIFWLLFQ